MRVRRGGGVMVVLALVLVAGVVAPGAAVTDPGGSGDGLVAVGPGGFSDVDEGSVHASAVRVLAAVGVFGGTECGEGLFCPDEPLQRSVMAVWLVRILDGADTTPVVSGVFSDVDYAEGYAPFADRLSELGVTRGCATGPLRYCPDRSVTRGQMAAFLVRAFGLEAGSAAGFTDVETGHTFVDDIDALAASRITAGCATGPLRYCPENHVTRAQMATFLARAAGLVDLPAPVGTQPEEPPAFDPFTTPTVSDIDLERLGAAVATLDPEVGCPPTAAPGSLDDVAEVVRISGGCLNVEYIPLAGRTIDEVREELASDSEVHAVDVPVTDDYAFDFPYDEAEQWHLEEIEANILWYGGTGRDGLRVFSGWPTEGTEVVVAVIDDGVDGTHHDLDANLVTTGDACHRRVNEDWDGDVNDHGTHVAGIIAAERNGRDVVGVAPQARILPIKKHYRDDLFDKNDNYLGPTDPHCFGLIPSTTAAVKLAMEQGADVINMSFGGPGRSATEEATIRAAMMRDIVVVASAGNCGTRGEEVCEKDGKFIEDRVTYPAAYSGVISVANTKPDGKQDRSSTANKHVGIAAPGRDIRSTVPAHSCFWPLNRTCTTADKTGTSMAAPVISGVVAHMKARFPKASVGEIRQALYTTAKNRDSGRTGHFTWEYGWGTVQPAAAIWNLNKYFFSCNALFESGKRLVAYDIDVNYADFDADGDTSHDDRRELFERRDVWVADEDGDNWCRVAANAAHPAWSPDGEQLAFAHRTLDVKLVETTNDRGETESEWVVEGRVDIWVTPTEGGPWRRVTSSPFEKYDLDWSAGGQIAYTAKSGGGSYAIFVVDASGSEESRLLATGLGGSKFQPSWSPDCTMIAFASNSDGDDDIWVMNMNTNNRNPRNLTTGSITVDGRTLADGRDEQPAFSPNGDQIVYVSDRAGGDTDIWVMNTDGTGHRVLHDNSDPEWKPAWSPEGDRILFAHNPGEPGTDANIWTMDAETGLGWELISRATADDVRFNAAAESNPTWSPKGTPPKQCQTPQPPPDDRQIRISWGSDATNRPDCPTDETCLNLQYEYIGTWDPPPYTLQCWTGNNRSWTGQWAGRETTGCYYWGEPAHVVIDGIQSNTITWTAPPPPDDRQVRISWGNDATNRPDCPTDETCLDLQYEYIGTWDPPPYTLQCWTGNNRSWTGPWAGQPEHGCYYWGEPAHVVIDGIQSNTINWTPPSTQDPPPLASASSIAAGLSHSCALRADGTAECWGADREGQATPPGGVFTAISAGDQHTCGLRTDGSVECWGAVWEALATPPAGSFGALAIGHAHACGLRTDGRVVCWGTNDFGQTDTPDGVFTAIAADVLHSCGIRTDRSIECWGTTYFTPPAGAFTSLTAWCAITVGGTVKCHEWFQKPPDGRFTALSSGGIFYTCGLRDNGTVDCWDKTYSGESTPPGGRFTAVASGEEYSCGIRTDGTVDCWGYNDGRTTPPAGTFTNVAVSRHSCGIKTDGTIECWGQNRLGESSPPQGVFTQVGAGLLFGCGLRADGTIECWGSQGGGQTAPPSGTFTDIAVGYGYACGIRTDKTVACWGDNSVGQATPPAGEFIAIAAGSSARSCGIRTDGTIECWGFDDGGTPPPAGTFTALTNRCGLRTDGTIECWGYLGWETGASPQGEFTTLTSGVNHTCGIRTDGTVACWGYHWDGRATPPSGEFTAISAGSEHTCGVRTDDTIECWGYNDGRATPPAGRFGPSKN